MAACRVRCRRNLEPEMKIRSRVDRGTEQVERSGQVTTIPSVHLDGNALTLFSAREALAMACLP
jgi:hypothetical protein